MGQKLIVGPMANGFKSNPLAFYIDNDAFPTLFNAYPWRGRIKRRRGTSLLTRLQRIIGTTDGAGNATITIVPSPIGVALSNFQVGSNFFADPGGASPVTLLTNGPGTATLNRGTGVLTIAGSNANTSVVYFPGLPVMGIRDFNVTATQFPGTVAFDTTYSYIIPNAFPYTAKDVSFYKNPPADPVKLPGYIPKGTLTPLNWNGQNFQQFWTTNYQGALWETNGITTQAATNFSMQFKPIVTVTVTAGGPPAIATLNIVGHGLVVGDFVFINEVATTTGINFQTGYVIAVIDANNVSVEFPNATIAGNGTGGIAQYLTSSVPFPTMDTLRWFDGDPGASSGLGWVNFSPPLFSGPPPFGVGDLPPAQYYLVGAQIVLQFKDRLLFFGPTVQASTGPTIYLQDTIVYSQNGTPYYTASFTGSVTSTGTTFHEILVPVNQTAAANAWFEDVTGYGGFLTAGYQSPITSVSPNEDVLIVGFNSRQTRLVYSGNDIVPFNFFIINSELGTGSTFSAINLDRGVLSVGNHGIVQTSQIGAQRIDVEIPDQVFQISLINNGFQRICSQRDFINEWIYFTFPSNEIQWTFPTQSLLYNYRDATWGLFGETYTTYGQFRKQTGFTWATVGTVYETWSDWDEPWNAGVSTLLNAQVAAGNTQGYIVIRENGTGESVSLSIQAIDQATGIITSPNHCLNAGDYFVITGALGTIGPQINGRIFSVADSSTLTTNTFSTDPLITNSPPLTYLGQGQITKIYIPQIKSKQFPSSWAFGRKTRLGLQQYLLTTTQLGQVSLLIYLSTDDATAYNNIEFPKPVQIVPGVNVLNNALIYSTIVYTCPELTNLSLPPDNITAPNINLQMLTSATQSQTWHRMNTSLIGDTVQIAVTLNDEQLRAEPAVNGLSVDITAATNANPCVLTAENGTIATGFIINANDLIRINGVVGMTQLNGKIFDVLSSNATTITINVDSTTFGAYVSGGVASVVENPNNFAEIELHGFILDLNASQVLA